MSGGRLMFNGDIIYPKKGNKSPAPIEGYEADPKDPWVHHKIYKPCKFRSFKTVPTPCGVKKYVYFCDKTDDITNNVKCDPCTQSESITQQTEKDNEEVSTTRVSDVPDANGMFLDELERLPDGVDGRLDQDESDGFSDPRED